MQWEAIRACVFNTLAAGGSVYVHCLAGVHRAPCFAAVLCAHLRGDSFDWALDHIRRLRAIEPQKVQDRAEGREAFTWLRRMVIHALCAGASHNQPQPACRWRQSSQHAKSYFKEDVICVDDILHGVALQRPWCRTCSAMLPAGVYSSLFDHHSVSLRKLGKQSVCFFVS